MALKEFAGTLPDFAKDIRLNVGSLLNETVLNDQRLVARTVRAGEQQPVLALVEATEAEVADKLSPEAANAARAAAAVMAMNNVYYRFTHLAGNEEYSRMPAKLRMNVIGAPGIDKVDFELFSLAVSAMNGCGMCIDSHEQVLKKAGVTAEVIQSSVRIASVMKAVATVHAAVA